MSEWWGRGGGGGGGGGNATQQRGGGRHTGVSTIIITMGINIIIIITGRFENTPS